MKSILLSTAAYQPAQLPPPPSVNYLAEEAWALIDTRTVIHSQRIVLCKVPDWVNRNPLQACVKIIIIIITTLIKKRAEWVIEKNPVRETRQWPPPRWELLALLQRSRRRLGQCKQRIRSWSVSSTPSIGNCSDRTTIRRTPSLSRCQSIWCERIADFSCSCRCHWRCRWPTRRAAWIRKCSLGVVFSLSLAL